MGDAMRALRLHEHGGPEQLRYEDRAPVPPTTTGDVLIAVHAASFTPGELDWPSTWVDRSGHDRRPVVPCHEVSGVVEALGFGAAGLCVGDEVYGLTDWYRDGAAADYVAVEARNVARKPASLDHVAAATIPLAGLTAWQGLFRHGALRPGQTVLIHGAGGGVGTLAVQLAHLAGARVVATGRPDAAELVTALGADVFADAADATFGDPGQVALVLDLVGGALLERSWPLVEPGGAVVSIAEPPDAQEAARRGVAAKYFVVEPDRAGLDELTARIDAGELRAVVGATCDLDEQAPAAIAAKERGGTTGKLALQVR
ncbi:NADP-dependent oxidoreductase [Conexibacter woesei]|uniref:NADP-dependent oxidoreductase n=1 Tax=Conexibacter woesei TaxID=191495 RepID=UPI0018CB24EB|nr:NADP-dependent oxidoreductase [Conexibacter woesei]